MQYTEADLLLLFSTLGAKEEKISEAMVALKDAKFREAARTEAIERGKDDLDDEVVDSYVTQIFEMAKTIQEVGDVTEGNTKSSHANSRADKQGIEVETPNGRLVMCLYQDRAQTK